MPVHYGYSGHHPGHRTDHYSSRIDRRQNLDEEAILHPPLRSVIIDTLALSRTAANCNAEIRPPGCGSKPSPHHTTTPLLALIAYQLYRRAATRISMELPLPWTACGVIVEPASPPKLAGPRKAGNGVLRQRRPPPILATLRNAPDYVGGSAVTRRQRPQTSAATHGHPSTAILRLSNLSTKPLLRGRYHHSTKVFGWNGKVCASRR